MKRFMISLTLVAIGAIAIMPAAHAATKDSSMSNQQSVSSLNQRVQHARDMRDSK